MEKKIGPPEVAKCLKKIICSFLMTTEIISSIPVEREKWLHIQPVMKGFWPSQGYVIESSST